MGNQCSYEQFRTDTKDHQVKVLLNEGLNRQIRCRKPGTITYGFDIITWPGYLCITGDCGTYVFSRIPDMFEFFDTGSAEKINPGYWGEKLDSICKLGGCKEFDEDQFRKQIESHYESYTEGWDDESKIQDLWEAIEDQVLSCIDDGEQEAYRATYNFDHNGFQFTDFFDGGGTEQYTFHYLWCLYAISWTVQQIKTGGGQG